MVIKSVRKEAEEHISQGERSTQTPHSIFEQIITFLRH